MKIKFIGVPGEDHESLNMFGVAFPLGRAVETHDPVICRKLSKHPHFSCTDGAEDVPFRMVTEIVGNVVDEPDPEPVIAQRSELEDLAAAAGVKVDGRWNDDRLRAEIEKAAAK